MNNQMRLINLFESVEHVERAFYEAFGTGDFALMESLYADEGVCCTHPNSPAIIGREKVIKNWEFVLKDIPQTVIKREVLNISRSPLLEVRQVLESYNLDDFSGRKSEIYTTNVYVFQENGWRIQMQHSSLCKINTPVPEETKYISELIYPQTSMAVN